MIDKIISGKETLVIHPLNCSDESLVKNGRKKNGFYGIYKLVSNGTIHGFKVPWSTEAIYLSTKDLTFVLECMILSRASPTAEAQALSRGWVPEYLSLKDLAFPFTHSLNLVLIWFSLYGRRVLIQSGACFASMPAINYFVTWAALVS